MNDGKVEEFQTQTQFDEESDWEVTSGGSQVPSESDAGSDEESGDEVLRYRDSKRRVVS